MALRTGHLFAGAGGGILADMLLGHTPTFAVEIEEYPRKVLLQRQIDGALPRFPIWDDVRTFRGEPWRGKVDIIAGGFPCTDISSAGKGAGLKGEKSRLWFEMARIIGEVRPAFVHVENSPLLVSRGLDRVLSDLARMGYNARWGIVSAADVGAPHLRKRLWIVANTSCRRCSRPKEWKDQQSGGTKVISTGVTPNTNGMRCTEGSGSKGGESEAKSDGNNAERRDRCSWWITEPDVGRVAHGIPSRVDRIKALGNAQVPRVAATAWNILTEGLELW